MIFLKSLIVAFVVSGILDFLTFRNNRKTSSLKKFVVRAPIDFAGLGTIGMAIIIAILAFGEANNEHVPLLVMVTFTIVGIIPAFMLMVAPIKGVWDVIVDGDDITIVKAFIFKRHWKFSDITYGKVTRGGMKVYVEGRKRKAFFVDRMCDGFSNFLKRMEKEEKEVIWPTED